MSKPAEVDALFKETAAAFKDPVSILVNNAGITKDGACLSIRRFVCPFLLLIRMLLPVLLLLHSFAFPPSNPPSLLPPLSPSLKAWY